MSVVWPPDPIATALTLAQNPCRRGDIATVAWEYSPAPGIDYTLTYYPQPPGSGNEEIIVTYPEIKDHSGPPGDNGLRPAVYKSIPLTISPVAFVLTAAYEGDARVYFTVATVN